MSEVMRLHTASCMLLRGRAAMNFELPEIESPADGLRGDPCRTPSDKQNSFRELTPKQPHRKKYGPQGAQ
jgi:hypothetical protein